MLKNSRTNKEAHSTEGNVLLWILAFHFAVDGLYVRRMKLTFLTIVYTLISCFLTFCLFAFLFNYAPENLPIEYYISLGWYFFPPILNLYLLKNDRIFPNAIPLFPLSILAYIYLYNSYNTIQVYQYLIIPYLIIVVCSLVLSFYPTKKHVA